MAADCILSPDEARALYEANAVPVREIARRAGITERTLYRRARSGDWHPRYRRRALAKDAAGRFIRAADAEARAVARALRRIEREGNALALLLQALRDARRSPSPRLRAVVTAQIEALVARMAA